MQRSWNQDFATNYQERGNYSSSPHYPHPTPVADPYPYPSSPTSQAPSYNRSPAPFHPAQSQVHQGQEHQGQAQQAPAMNGYPASPQHEYEPSHYHQQSHSSMMHNFDQQVVDRREQPEMDEDFPSYKDLRNVFLQKQKQADAEERFAPVTRRQFGQAQSNAVPSIAIRKPPPTPPKKPSINVTSSRQQDRSSTMPQTSYQQQDRSPMMSQSIYQQQDRNPVMPQTSHQQQSHAPTSQTSKSSLQITSQARQSRYSQPNTPTSYHLPASTYTEIPVQHMSRTMQQNTQIYDSRQPTGRVEMGYRPPMSINISSPQIAPPAYDGPSPRVRITSNSPMSPQRAWYRPDSEEESLIIPRRSNRRHSVSFAPIMMGSAANQPRRRTSYAEIIMSSPQSPMPQSLTASSPGLVQRSFTQVTTNRVVSGAPDAEEEESFPSFKELKTQFSRQESSDLSRGYKVEPFGMTYATRQGGHQGNAGFTRINVKPPQGSTELDMAQRQAPGWSATVQTGNAYTPPTINASPNVQYTPTTGQPGKTAAHLQYNSPMGLYSTSKAQESLNWDPEAAELLKISGPKGNSTLRNSPTLQAVLKEDSIKRQTGHNANVGYYHTHHEYGPGIGPLRQYEEVPDTLRQTITAYNQSQDRSLAYPMWYGIH